jgi:hypothetical protein
MSSRRDQIVTACVALLGGAGRPSGLQVDRVRTVSLSHDQLPRQVVYPLQEEVVTGPGIGAAGDPRRIAKRVLTLCVEHRVDAENDAPDLAIDPFVSWAVQALCADVELGGLAFDVKEIGTKWDEAEQDKVYAAARTLFEIQYVTDAANPDTLS